TKDPISLRTSLDPELDTAIAFLGGERRNAHLRHSVADDRDALRGYAELDEEVTRAPRTSLRELLVVLEVADGVGVALHAHLRDLRVRVDELREADEEPVALGLHASDAELEVDAVVELDAVGEERELRDPAALVRRVALGALVDHLDVSVGVGQRL